MTKQTRALQMAINALTNCSGFEKAIQACKEALEPTVAELNDEYLRDTHVEGIPKEPYNLVAILNDPMKAYPHNFNTPAKGNALLFGLCQEAADEIDRRNKMSDIDQYVKTNGKILLAPPILPKPPKQWNGLTAEEIASIPLNEHTVQAVEDLLREKNHE